MRIKSGESVCLDTNILLDATDEGRKHHAKATEIFRSLPSVGVIIQLSTQVLREYLVVATRPTEKNGLGMGLEDAVANIKSFCECSRLIEETVESFNKMLDWSLAKGTCGRHLHDLQILATAKLSGADVFLTSNVDDFPSDLGLRIVAMEDLQLNG